MNTSKDRWIWRAYPQHDGTVFVWVGSPSDEYSEHVRSPSWAERRRGITFQQKVDAAVRRARSIAEQMNRSEACGLASAQKAIDAAIKRGEK